MDGCSRIFMLLFVQCCCLTLLTCDYGICSVRASSCIPSEREALLKLKLHLIDPSNRLSSWNASNPNCCHWFGVVCSNLTSHILHLHLNTAIPEYYRVDVGYKEEEAIQFYLKSRFGGELSHSLVELKHLSYLDLSGNAFGGMPIPSFLCQITTLTYLNLSHAGFHGIIPHQIGNLSNLLYLDLAFSVKGTIPYQIGNLSNLIHLNLNSYPVVVENLQWLSSLSSLQYLDLSQANLSKSLDWLQTMQALPSLMELQLARCTLGDYNQPSTLNFSSLLSLSISVMPEWIFGLSKLVALRVVRSSDDFRISGPIPHDIQNLTNLEILDLSENSFSSIPNGLYCLHHLKSLILNRNSLNETISDSMGNMTSLVNLGLSYNQLKGVIPPSLGSLNSLLSLDLFSNQLKGVIPTSLGSLHALVNLDLSYNQLEGVIPTSLGSLHSLAYLDLSFNQLEGMIPTCLGSLNSLLSLDLSYNQFEGVIPTSLGSLHALVNLDLSYNQLKGVIPKSFSNLCNLKRIDFSNIKCNQQVSEIIKIFFPCVSRVLVSLNAHNSQISGYFTDQIGMFKNLVELDFSNNSISGELPLSFRKLASLSELDLSKNQLNGNPFKSLGSLPKLSYLDIRDNLFQGVVQEDDLANLTTLLGLYASGNNLTLKVGQNWQPSFHVIDLFMTSWQLGPSFPSWIQSQTGLTNLEMSNTGISDFVPTWFWRTFPQMSDLNLSHNCIHGELPNTLNNLRYIRLVDLSSNCLYGKIPYLPIGLSWLDLSNNSFSGSLTHFLFKNQTEPNGSLQFLNLESNNLSGEIPDCWKMWSSLIELNLQSNGFTGSLPPSMGSLAELQSLRISNNKLSGEFPLIFKNTSKLISLDIGENNLTGVIPAWVGGRLLNLKIFRLRSNKFSGIIPHEIFDMKFLQDLDLAHNHLSGNIPKCLNHLSSMVINKSSVQSSSITLKSMPRTSIISVLVWVKGFGIEYRSILGLVKNIDLSCNELSGEIPKEIIDLSALIFLNLSRNQLSGHIPQSIGNMRSLECIDFSRNKLSGEIPSSMTNLSFLSKLDLSYNHLKGKIPTGTQLQTLEDSNFAGNDLCGPPLLVNCSLDGEVPNADGHEKGSDGHEVRWLFVSVAFGFIVGFWGVVAPLFIYRSWRFTYFRFLDNMWYKLQSMW